MTTNITLSEALAARAAKHNEAISLMSQIEAAQNTINELQTKLSKLNPAVSYYKPVADVYAIEIENQAQFRNEAVCKYERLMWKLYSASLPSISNTGIQEVAITLYSATAAHA